MFLCQVDAVNDGRRLCGWFRQLTEQLLRNTDSESSETDSAVNADPR